MGECECISKYMGFLTMGTSLSIISFCLNAILIRNLFVDDGRNKKINPAGIEMIELQTKKINVSNDPGTLEDYIMTIGETIENKPVSNRISI